LRITRPPQALDFGGIPFILALIPFFKASLKVLVPAALATFAFGWVNGGSERWRNITRGSTKGKRGKKDRSDSNEWVMGSSSSSSGSGSSSSSSSFGGGKSGGGGASGSW